MIWYEDWYSFLFSQENLIKFIPDKNYTIEENLNASLRFAIYLSLFVFLVKRDPRIFFFAAVVGLVTLVIYKNENKENATKKELFDRLSIDVDKKKKYCLRPTNDNPFMNVSFADYTDFPNRPPACDITKSNVKHDVVNRFSRGLYKDVDDVFSRKASDRQFYTNPITTIPNNQSGFAEWCFKTAKTCKEKPSKCY